MRACPTLPRPRSRARRLRSRQVDTGHKIAAHVAAEEERKQHAQDGRERATASEDDPRCRHAAKERQRDSGARVSDLARNLELGAALAKWQPKLDTDAR